MRLTRRHALAGLAGLSALAALPALGRDALRLSGNAFGTTWSIILPRGMAGDEAGEIATALAGIDRAMSPFRADSEISAFNTASAGRLAVGADFARVTTEALRIARWSGGAFDPTLGPLVGRYGFGPIHGERVGDYRGLSCTESSVGKSVSGLTLDLCGIAKGYALDKVAGRLRALGHTDFLIDIGGELLAAGQAPQGGAWRLGIEDPRHGGVHTRLSLTGLALATSGDAVNAYEVSGRRYSHTMDPFTGEPVRNAIASVSVIHPSAMSADGIATAMLVLGLDDGLALANAESLPVHFLIRDGNGLRALSSAAFSDLMMVRES